MPSIRMPQWLEDMNPTVRNVIALALAGAALMGALLLGPLRAVFGGVTATGPIEYGAEDVNLADYLHCDDDSVSVEVTGTINTSKVGSHTVAVNLSKWFISNPIEATLIVRDSQPPVIKLRQDSITAEVGEKVTPADNIVSVKDPVDGRLVLVNVEPEAKGSQPGTERFYEDGWFMVDDAFVASEAGTRDITVTACDQFGNRVTASFTLTVTDPLDGVKLNKTTKILEYGSEPLDPLTLVKCSDADTEVTAKPVKVSRVGKRRVTYTLKKRKSTREEKRTFYVRDTQAPTIELAGTEVSVAQFEAYDPVSNVSRVSDPVDGDLASVKVAPEAKGTKVGRQVFYDQGWFMVSGAVDVNTLGSYPVSVTARDRHGNEATASFTVKVVDPLDGVTLTATTTSIEYARGSIDPTRLVRCSDSSVQVSAPSLNASTLGTQTVTFTLKKGKSTRTAQMSFTVRDTQAPLINLRSGTVSIAAGSAFDPYANVVSVSDPVDGSLSRVSSLQSSAGNGWYTITGSYDTSTAGSYTLQVQSSDRNGNRASKSYTLRVTE